VPSLEAVWRAVFPQAELAPATTAPALERPVAWVRVLKARVPAFDAMDPDDLAILPRATLGSLAALAVEPAAVVDAIAQARGAGVVVVAADEGADAMTDDVLQRAAAGGLGAFRLSETDVSALERSAIAYIVNGQAELERRVAALEAELEQVALAGEGPPGLAASIARFLARPVVIEGPDGGVLAVHAPTGSSDAAGVGSYLKRRRGAALRLALPLATDDSGSARSGGALVLLGAGSVTELERAATARVAALVALEVGRGSGVRVGAERRSDGLPADGPPWVVVVSRQIDDAAPTTLQQRERLRHDLARLEPRRRLSLRGDAASVELRLVAALTDDDPRGLTVAARVAAHVGRPVALSRPFANQTERPIMEAQARATLEAVEHLPPAEQARLAASDGAVVAVHELAPAYRLVGALPALPDARRQAEALLAPLMTGRAQRDAEALATLRAVLDHPGMAEAAAALGVHRNTLAYRLNAIERRTGWRLSQPLLRMALALAVRAVQNDQETGATATVMPARTASDAR
jgi:hypothetical protein